jgi:hypothetical protein
MGKSQNPTRRSNGHTRPSRGRRPRLVRIRTTRVRLPRSLLSPLFDQDATNPRAQTVIRPGMPSRLSAGIEPDAMGSGQPILGVAVVRSTALWPLGGSIRGLNFSSARFAGEEPCRPDAGE